MIDRFSRFPADLARRARPARLGPSQIPALLAHPDWKSPAPFVIWLHGRTVSKELDPGRYLRWVRAGIAACAIDLPGHGERAGDGTMQNAERSLDVLEQVIPEIDQVVEALAAPEYSREGGFDLDRPAIGGMSAGGMAVLRRLCDIHPFLCASVEATTGDLAGLYFGERQKRWPIQHPPERVARLDPMQHLDTWRPIPVQAFHSEQDRIIPIDTQRRFLDGVRAIHRARAADESLVELVTWPQTGAPEEHLGFGRFANDAKNLQAEFFRKHLLAST